MGLQEKKYSPSVPYPITPPWMFPPMILDLHRPIQDEIKRLKGKEIGHI